MVVIGRERPRSLKQRLQMGLRRRLLEDTQGSLRQVPGDTLATVLRAEAATSGARPGLTRRAFGQADLVGGVAYMGAVTEASARPVMAATPTGATAKTSATNGVEVAETGCLGPAAQAPTPALGSTALQEPVVPSGRGVNDAGPVAITASIKPDAVMAMVAALGSPHAVAIVVDVDTATPAATLTVRETGVVHTAVHGARLEGRKPGAPVA